MQDLGPIRNTPASDHLDMIRGMAAVAVLAGHVRSLFFVDFNTLQNPSIVAKAAYFITSLGHASVIVFFVLSGFFIGGAVCKDVRANCFVWDIYLLNRLTRLYLVLLPSLILTGAWDQLGLHLFGKTSIYYGDSLGAAVFKSSIVGNTGPFDFLGNLFFLQGICCQPFGSNTPLWSLSYEFWYYILFPVILLAVLPSKIHWTWRILYLSLAAGIALLLAGPILSYFGIWLVGVVIATLPRPKNSNLTVVVILQILSLLALFASLLVLRSTGRFNEFEADLTAAVFTGLVVYACTMDLRQRSAGKYAWLAEKLSGFSYSLYLCHMSFLVILRQLVVHHERLLPTVTNVGLAVAIGIIVIAYSYAVSRLTEARTAETRQSLRRVALKLQPVFSRLWTRS